MYAFIPCLNLFSSLQMTCPAMKTETFILVHQIPRSWAYERQRRQGDERQLHVRDIFIPRDKLILMLFISRYLHS